VFLYRGKYFDIKFHSFNDTKEEIPHDHKNNFISVILNGCYLHCIYRIAASEGNNLVQQKRMENTFTDQEWVLDSTLQIQAVHSYTINDSYFMDQSTCHSVAEYKDMCTAFTCTIVVTGKGTKKVSTFTSIMTDQAPILPTEASSPLDVLGTNELLELMRKVCICNKKYTSISDKLVERGGQYLSGSLELSPELSPELLPLASDSQKTSDPQSNKFSVNDFDGISKADLVDAILDAELADEILSKIGQQKKSDK